MTDNVDELIEAISERPSYSSDPDHCYGYLALEVYRFERALTMIQVCLADVPQVEHKTSECREMVEERRQRNLAKLRRILKNG